MAETTVLLRRLIPVGKVAEKLGLCPRTVFRLAKEGTIPSGVKIGDSRRWDEFELDEWIKLGCQRRTNRAG